MAPLYSPNSGEHLGILKVGDTLFKVFNEFRVVVPSDVTPTSQFFHFKNLFHSRLQNILQHFHIMLNVVGHVNIPQRSTVLSRNDKIDVAHHTISLATADVLKCFGDPGKKAY